MNKFAPACLAALAFAAAAQAEIPVYRGQQLEVPTGIVMTEEGPVYYGDVRFTANADGSFTLAQAKRRTLTQVESATVSVADGSATVTAKGELVVACAGLEEPGLVRQDDTFYVVLAETHYDPQTPCLPIVAVTKFTQDVEIDVRALEPGEYEVDVNGVITTFTLE